MLCARIDQRRLTTESRSRSDDIQKHRQANRFVICPVAARCGAGNTRSRVVRRLSESLRETETFGAASALFISLVSSIRVLTCDVCGSCRRQAFPCMSFSGLFIEVRTALLVAIFRPTRCFTPGEQGFPPPRFLQDTVGMFCDASLLLIKASNLRRKSRCRCFETNVPNQSTHPNI